jgi:hypothetical protein
MPDTLEVQQDRKAAIAAAVEAVVPAVEEKAEPEKVEEKKEEKLSEADVEAEKALREQGFQLIKALQDPAQQGIVIDFLARNAGYTKGEIKQALKDEEKGEELAADLTSLLKESLGGEYDFLADKIAKGVEKYIDKKNDENLKEVKTRLESQERDRLESQGLAIMNRMGQDFFGDEKLPDNVVAEMNKYMDRIPPLPEMGPKDYLEDAFYHAVGKLGLTRVTKAQKEQQERANKNRNDAPSRLASDRVPSEDRLRRQGDSKPRTRKEIIAEAAQQAEREMTN